MGVFGAIGSALKAPAKVINKAPGMGALKKALPGMNQPAPKPAGGMAGAVRGAMGPKMGLGPSQPPMQPSMNAIQSDNQENMMPVQGMNSVQGMSKIPMEGPSQVVNAPPGYGGGMQTPQFAMDDLQRQQGEGAMFGQMQDAPSPQQGIGPSFGGLQRRPQMNPMMNRPQMPQRFARD